MGGAGRLSMGQSSLLGMARGVPDVDHVALMAGNGEPIRVFLCDDVEAFRALMRSSLADDPRIEVVGEAADGEEGVERVADLQPDVVLLDMSMPRVDGLEAIPHIRRRAPSTSIIGLSSHGAARMAEPWLAKGADAYLEKGVELDEIRAAIHQTVTE
jgi:DNA-binding NarL/FixJ family response regulator